MVRARARARVRVRVTVRVTVRVRVRACWKQSGGKVTVIPLPSAKQILDTKSTYLGLKSTYL